MPVLPALYALGIRWGGEGREEGGKGMGGGRARAGGAGGGGAGRGPGADTGKWREERE